MVPFSETLVRLWQLTVSGEFLPQLLDSAKLFLTGFVLALIVGAPLGLLFARVRVLRIGIEPYIMILYATPMVALIPFILSLMGFGFAPKVLVVFLFTVFPVLYNTVEGARSIKPELIEVAKSYRSTEWALWREVMLPYTLPYMMTGVRQAIGRALVGMIAAEFFLSSTGARPADHGRVAGLRHRRRVRLHLRHRRDRRRPDAARPEDRAALRALEAVTMAEQAMSAPAPAAHKPQAVARRDERTLVPRLITGAVILGAWEIVVRAFAPRYVAKPTGMVMADSARHHRSEVPDRARADAGRGGRGPRRLRIVLGTAIGLLMGRSTTRRPHDPRLHQWLQRDADDHRAAAVLAVVRLFERGAHRHHHLRRDLRHHHERRRRRPRGAARISRSGALVPFRPLRVR